MLEVPKRHPLPERVQLPPEPDETFDQFAALARRILGVPTAMVSLVDQSRQVFPGAVGLPPPWQQQRETPLSHSFCQHVVVSGEPLVVNDARSDPRVQGNLAIDELGVIAYAGAPITGLDGVVVGSLCAINGKPRSWTEDELLTLAQLASACSAELAHRTALRAQARTEERDRIVAALQDHVITDLLAAALTAAQLRSVVIGRAAALGDQLLDELDDVLRQLRNSVYDRGRTALTPPADRPAVAEVAPPEISTTPAQHIAVLHWANEVDLDTIAAIRNEIDETLATGVHALVIDLEHVAFVDSLGVGTLVYALNECRARGAVLSLRNVSDRTHHVLEMTGLSDTFTVEAKDAEG